MAQVALNGLCKTYRTRTGPLHALRNLGLSIESGELLTVVGPSGCGKTTLLRLIAGLDSPTSGTVAMAGRSTEGVDPKDRDVAMVFQHPALYPHLSVRENLAFGLRVRRIPRAEVDRRVDEIAATLNLEPLLPRRPASLSGGECQIVALGRAAVRNPRVFLLDEPLSSLDPPLRGAMRTRIKALQRTLAATMIYVTHDQAEAMALGDRVAVLCGGVLQQCGPPMEVYHQPVNRFVAGFLGDPGMNLLPGRIDRDSEEPRIAGPAGPIPLPASVQTALARCNDRNIVVGVRAEDLRLGPGPGSAEGSDGSPGLVTLGEARVVLLEPFGDRTHVHLETDGGARLIAKSGPDAAGAGNGPLPLLARADRIRIFAADESGARLA